MEEAIIGLYGANKEAFTKQGIKVAWAYFEGAIDKKLSTRLVTLRDDEGEKMITDTMAISTILDQTQELMQIF